MNEIKKEIKQLLARMINIPSINPPGLEKQMVDLVSGYMKTNGFLTKVIEVQNDRKNVIAKLEGKDHTDGIIFTGHMDVVPVSEDELKRWNTNPFEATEIDGYLYGRGSSDMKAGLATAMVAMKYMKQNKIVPEKDIFLVATVDEEDYMLGSKKSYNDELLKNCKSVVVCEPTDLEICIGSKGRTYGNVFIKGHTGHGSGGKSMGNSILIANELINNMNSIDFSENYDKIIEGLKKEYNNEKILKKYGVTFWQPLAINAGVEPCVVPDSCTVKVDSRLSITHKSNDIWNIMNEIISNIETKIVGSKLKYEIIDQREPFVTSNSAYILQKTEKAYQNNKLECKKNVFQGTTDGTILKRAKREVIIMGPGNLACVHKENEKLHIEELEKAFSIYVDIMK